MHTNFNDDHALRTAYRTNGLLDTDYLDALNTIWKKAADCDRDPEDGSFDLLNPVRWALIRGTINSTISNYVPELVMRAVTIGYWTPQQAITIAQAILDSEKRTALCLLLLKSDIPLTPDQHTTVETLVYDAAFSSDGERIDYRLLTQLVPHLHDQQKLMTILAEAQKEESQKWEIGLHLALASRITSAVQRDLLTIVLDIVEEHGWIIQKGEITQAAALFDDDQLWRAVRYETNNLTGLKANSQLVTLLPYIPPAARTDLLKRLLKTGTEFQQAQLFSECAEYLTETTRSRTVARIALAILRANTEFALHNYIPKLFPYLSWGDREQVVDVILRDTSGTFQLRMLLPLIPFITQAQRAQIMAFAAVLRNPHTRPQKPVERPQRRFGTVLFDTRDLLYGRDNADSFDGAHAYLLIALSASADEKVKRKLLRRAVKVVAQINDVETPLRVMIHAAQDADIRRDCLPRILDLFESEQYRYYDANCVTDLMQVVTADERQQAIDRLLKHAQAIQDAERKLRLLLVVAPHLTKEEDHSSLRFVLDTILAMREYGPRQEGLSKVAPLLNKALIAHALDAAFDVDDHADRANCFLYLAARVSPSLHAAVIRDAYATARRISASNVRYNTLIQMLPLIDDQTRAALLDDLIESLWEIRFTAEWYDEIKVLLPQLDPLRQKQILHRAEAALDNEGYLDDYNYGAIVLAPFLDAHTRSRYLFNALEYTVSSRHGEQQEQRTAALFLLLDDEGRTRALEEFPVSHYGWSLEAMIRNGLQGFDEDLFRFRHRHQDRFWFGARELEWLKHLVLDDGIATVHLAPKLLEAVLARMNPGEIAGMLAQIGAIEDAEQCADALSATIPSLDKTQSHDAYLTALRINSPYKRANLLIRLVPKLEPSAQADARKAVFEAAIKFPHATSRFETLAALLPLLSPTEKPQAITGMVDALTEMGWFWYGATHLVDMFACLRDSPDLLAYIVRRLPEIPLMDTVVSLVHALLPMLDASSQRALLKTYSSVPDLDPRHANSLRLLREHIVDLTESELIALAHDLTNQSTCYRLLRRAYTISDAPEAVLQIVYSRVTNDLYNMRERITRGIIMSYACNKDMEGEPFFDPHSYDRLYETIKIMGEEWHRL